MNHVIILSSYDGEVLGTTLRVADGITLRLDEGTELGSSDGSSDGYNELVIGSDEGIVSFQLNLSLLNFQLLSLFFNFAQSFSIGVPRPRPRPRRHPTPYVAVVPLVSVLAIMSNSFSLQLISPCPAFLKFRPPCN